MDVFRNDVDFRTSSESTHRSDPLPGADSIKATLVFAADVGVCMFSLTVRRSSLPPPSAAIEYKLRNPNRLPRYTIRVPSAVQSGAWLLPALAEVSDVCECRDKSSIQIVSTGPMLVNATYRPSGEIIGSV